ncbi:MAG: hypothetical protein NMNS02_01420 [Nitrosomonas sp.]|nr:MAG: hypothetical protein NMNS02_01420 [Nitrosomonas sp.]
MGEYGEMLFLGRYFSDGVRVPQDKGRGQLLMVLAAFKGDEKARQLLFKYQLQLLLFSGKLSLTFFLVMRILGSPIATLRHYGSILLYDGYYLKSHNKYSQV